MPDFRAQQFAFAAHLRDPAHHPAPATIEDRRIAIYRDLFFNNVLGFMRTAFPVIRETLGDDALTGLVRDWFATHRARTPLFPRMPGEFVAWLATAPDAPADRPGWLTELAHYEWVELALELDEAEVDVDDADPAGDLVAGIPALSPLAWPLAYVWPVHRIGPGFTPDTPPAQPTTLVVYRGRDDKVGFMETNPVTHRLLQLLAEDAGLTGHALITRIAEELGLAVSGALLEPGRDILERLRERSVISGAKPK
jgi:hypothetical protein